MSPTSCAIIVIARAELTPALRERLDNDPAVIVFGASETSHALEVIAERRPSVVVFERLFAESSVGQEFLASVRGLSTVADTELRLLHDEGTDIPVLLRRQSPAPGRIAIATTSQVLPHRDARRALRYRVQPGLTAVVNGAETSLVNLSIGGAQVVAAAILRPSQHVRVALPDEQDELRLSATIAWSIFEQCHRTKQPQFRAGVEFHRVDVATLESYCVAHRQEI